MSPAARASLQPSVQVLGEINVDLIARVERPPRPGEMVVDGELTRMPGGKGANQAAVAARLGARVRMIGAVGRDATGMEMRRALELDGVSTAAVQDTAQATGTALIIMDSAGIPTLVVCRGANGAIEPGRLSIEPQTALLAHMDIDALVIQRAIAHTEGLVVLDCSTPRDLTPALVDRVDVFVTRDPYYDLLPEAARNRVVACVTGSGDAFITRGGIEIARVEDSCFDGPNPVGARDAFAAALTVSLVRGWSEQQALRAACAVAASAGADVSSRPQLGHLDAYLTPSPAGGDGGV
jgi:ribokinase